MNFDLKLIPYKKKNDVKWTTGLNVNLTQNFQEIK